MARMSIDDKFLRDPREDTRMPSPIESQLYDAIVDLAPACGAWIVRVDAEIAEIADDDTSTPTTVTITIDRQIDVHGYRADMLITAGCVRYTDGSRVNFDTAIVVECDGHDWHERTKQQAAYDRARDRDLLRKGYITVRFTGAEIHRDANQCAREVYEILDAIDRARHADCDAAIEYRERPRPAPGEPPSL